MELETDLAVSNFHLSCSVLFHGLDFRIYEFKNWLRNMVIEVFLKFRLGLMN